MFPNGRQKEIRFTESVHEETVDGQTVAIYTRGSVEYEQLTDMLDDYERSKEEIRKRAEDEAEAKLQEELAALDEATAEGENDGEEGDGGSNARNDGPITCVKNPPHFDCDVCKEEDGAPKHFKSPGGLNGHKNSRAHKEAAGTLNV